MRSRTLILMATVLTLLGLVVPASAAFAEPASSPEAAAAEIRSQLPDDLKPVFDQFVSEAGQLADVVASGVVPEVTAANPEVWEPSHLPIWESVQELFAFFKANWAALMPHVIYLLKSLIPAVPFLVIGLKPLVLWIGGALPTLAPIFVGLLCAVGADLLPAFAALVKQVCDFVKGILPTILGLLPALFKLLPGLLLPLVTIGCDLAAKFFPTQAALIKTGCDLIKDLLTPTSTTSTAPTTTTTIPPTTSSTAAATSVGSASASGDTAVVIAASPAVAGRTETSSSAPYGLIGMALSAMASLLWVLRRRTVYAG